MAFSVETATYKVITRGVMGDSTKPGGRLLQGVPRKVENPGMVTALAIGSTVVLDHSLGFPFIDGVLNINTSRAQADDGALATNNIGGDVSIAEPADGTTEEAQGFYRDARQPKDLLEGDLVMITEDGNRMGACRGRYNVMDSGPGTKAKVETFGEKDLTRITTEDFELLTGFGLLQIHNAEGRCGLSFKAGADQLSESGGEEEQWTMKLDIGDDGDFFNLEVNSPDGKTAAQFNIKPDGKVTLVGAKGIDMVAGDGAQSQQEYAAGLVTKIIGKALRNVEGAVTEIVSSNRTTTVSETDSLTAGHNHEVAANNHQILNVGGNQYNTITGGSPLEATPLNVAVETQVLNGSYHLELGNPLKGANPAAMAGMTLAVNNGDIVLGQNPDPLSVPATRATVSMNTLLPNSVGLGGTANPLSSNPATFHAVKYENLATMLMAMMAIFDTHTHVPPVGGIPAALMTPLLSSLLPMMMCTRVVMSV